MNVEQIPSALTTEHSPVTTEELEQLTTVTELIPKAFADSTSAVKAELEIVINAINTWERVAPQLYQIKKRLMLCEELLSGKRDLESVSSIPSAEAKTERKKRGPAKGSTRTFVRRKSDILTDEVIEKIRDLIASDEEWHKSKEIYRYLIENHLIPEYPGDFPERTFAIALSRVDQDQIVYNKDINIMAWGLPDFGTPEHARRRTLKNSVRGKAGTKVTSYGRSETVPV